jgi:hypothetical protein
LTRHTTLSKKVARTEKRHHRFFAALVDDCEFHAALLDVHHSVSGLSLGENRLSLSKRLNLPRYSDRLEINLRVKVVFLFGFHIPNALRNKTIDRVPMLALTMPPSSPNERN